MIQELNSDQLTEKPTKEANATRTKRMCIKTAIFVVTSPEK